MIREIYDKAASITVWLWRHDEESRACVEMWTAQESLPNVEKVFVCRDSTFSPDLLKQTLLLQLFFEAAGGPDLGLRARVGAGFNLPRATEDFRKIFNDRPGESPVDFYDTLRGCRHRLATDPRDKVFGALGLLDEAQRADPLPAIDYGLCTGAVFTSVARYLLRTTNSLHWLEAVGPSDTNVRCPSWALNWSNYDHPNEMMKRMRNRDGSILPAFSSWGSNTRGAEESSRRQGEPSFKSRRLSWAR
jgi:hypothetical protein